MSITEPRIEPCPHCKGAGTVTIPPEVETIEVYYFGCIDGSGHRWSTPKRSDVERVIIDRVGPTIHPKIDGGFCPPDRQLNGEAALHYVSGWTILSFWDRSVDARYNSCSAFVARGRHDYVAMVLIAKAQFPIIWNRYSFTIELVSRMPAPELVE